MSKPKNIVYLECDNLKQGLKTTGLDPAATGLSRPERPFVRSGGSARPREIWCSLSSHIGRSQPTSGIVWLPPLVRARVAAPVNIRGARNPSPPNPRRRITISPIRTST